jgi:Ribosomal protein S19
MIIVPEMIGSTVAVYNGKIFNVVDVKAEMVGYYLGEFSITYRYVFTFKMFLLEEAVICIRHTVNFTLTSQQDEFLETVCSFTKSTSRVCSSSHSNQEDISFYNPLYLTTKFLLLCTVALLRLQTRPSRPSWYRIHELFSLHSP